MKNKFALIIEQINTQLGGIAGKTILDVGTMNGRLPALLADSGAIVTAIDIKPLPQDAPNQDKFTFIQIPFEYFNISEEKKHYDVAIAENVLPFLADKKYSMQKFLEIADAQVFNVWGHNHVWAKSRLTYSPEQIEQLKSQILETHDILSFDEKEYDTPTISNPNELSHWHEYTFVVKRK